MNKEELISKMGVFELKNYSVKTQKKGDEIYYILEKKYYSYKEDKFIQCGSLFIDRSMAIALVWQLGVRLFDFGKVFDDFKK